MNQSHFEHIGYALVFQSLIGFITGDWWAGAAFGASFFIGREHAQAENRYIAANGGWRYRTPQPPELGALRASSWDLDSLLDWIAPSVAVLVIPLTMYSLNHFIK